MRAVALANQKGGVGKTTTAVHLAHGLDLAGRQVVLVDLDPQGNATLAVQEMLEAHAGEAQLATAPFSNLRRFAQNAWILPSTGTIDPNATPDTNKLRTLRARLGEHGVEWLIVDCPPRMDAWGCAGVRLCDEILIPVQAEFFALHGLSQIVGFWHKNADSRHRDRLGVVPTMVVGSEPIALEVVDELRRHFDAQVTRTSIYRDPLFVEAASHGRTLFDYDIDSKGAWCYGTLVREMLYGRP